MNPGDETAWDRTHLPRRSFIHRCAICAGVMAVPPAWAKLLATGQHDHPESVTAPAAGPLAFQCFTQAQVATVEAMTEQIIPADEDPGAKWAGVVHYIDLALAGEFAKLRPAYETGLARLAVLAKGVSPKSFAELDFVAQTKILEKLESDEGREGNGVSGREFFQLVRRQTLEGFFGDPKYGGNRDFVGWKMLKFEV
jgi:gluconate 2-dehydrogenase gamma chain